MRQISTIILNAANTGTQTGSTIDARQLFNASFQIINGDSTAAGTVKIQASNDNPPNGAIAASFTPTNWGDVPSASTTLTAGVPAAAFIRVIDMDFTWVRAVFTETTPGTTTIQVSMNAQGV